MSVRVRPSNSLWLDMCCNLTGFSGKPYSTPLLLNYPHFSLKEVIQPHLPVRLPCYDFTPITSSTFDNSLLAVGTSASGVSDSHGVTGGVYKARERIQRSIADLRLLAIPSSCSRVADCNLN
jgi:hypothetical protein